MIAVLHQFTKCCNSLQMFRPHIVFLLFFIVKSSLYHFELKKKKKTFVVMTTAEPLL